MTQQQLLFPLDVVKLKQGKDKCPCCGKIMRSYKKTLDDRLVELGYEALRFLIDNKRKIFRVKEVWKEHEKINDFQKLSYFGLYRKVEKRSGWWEITQKGWGFLVGGKELPRCVWIFNNRVLEESEEMTHVEDVKKRWQTEKGDYTLDYSPFRYKTEIQVPQMI